MQHMPTVLVIDDNADVAKALNVLFTLHEIECLSAISPQAGLRQLAERPVDLVIQDMNFSGDTTSGSEGIELFHRIREINPDLPIILLTAWADLETAVQLVKAGAADYLSKPWNDNKLLTSVQNLLELNELRQQNRNLTRQYQQEKNRLAQQFNLCGLVYNSNSMLRVLQLATQVAHAQVPVLITGPNGCGKERIADIIQANSLYREGPFVKVNVGALPLELMEAELFGAEAGAFTGAQKKRIGRFEAAHQGTLFLDEIGNLSPIGQMKLLRVLQTGEFERLGSHETLKTDVRIISATNTDLKAAIDAGEFREDLYYRLNVIELAVPPLVERKADILPLAYRFLEQNYTLSGEAEHALLRYTWPGNVRELQNSIKRALLLCRNRTIYAADFGDEILRTSQHVATANVDNEPDKALIVATLRQTQGVVAKAARILGLSRQALYRRMEKFAIHVDEY